jgi:hypothetical protein
METVSEGVALSEMLLNDEVKEMMNYYHISTEIQKTENFTVGLLIGLIHFCMYFCQLRIVL